MAIVSSGQLALSAIRDEFGAGTTSNVNLRTLSAAAGLSVPDGFNEFYGLSAFTPAQYVSGAQTISGSGTAASPYIVRSYMPYTFDTTEEYAGCDSLGYSEIVYWAGRSNINNRPVFRITNLNPMRLKMQITTFDTDMCTAGPSYAAIYSDSTYWTGSPSYLSAFSYGGDGTTARNLIINQVYDGGTIKPGTAVNSTFSIYIQTQHSYKVETDGIYGDGCDGFYDDSQTFSCANPLSVTNLTFKIWFEPA